MYVYIILFLNTRELDSSLITSSNFVAVVPEPGMRADRGQTSPDRRWMGRVGLVERVLENLRCRYLDRRAEMRSPGASARREVLHR